MAQIIITASLALLVFFTVIIYAFLETRIPLLEASCLTLYVFGAFVTMLGAVGILGWLGAVIIPLAMTVALMALELLIAFLQAYVFAILTCIYLNDAIHPGHRSPRQLRARRRGDRIKRFLAALH